MEGKAHGQTHQLRGMTVGEMKQLQRGDRIHDIRHIQKDGTCATYRVSGRVETWKTVPSRVSFPAQFGARNSGHVRFTAMDKDYLHREADCQFIQVFFTQQEPGNYGVQAARGGKIIATGRLVDQKRVSGTRKDWVWEIISEPGGRVLTMGNALKFADAKAQATSEVLGYFARQPAVMSAADDQR